MQQYRLLQQHCVVGTCASLCPTLYNLHYIHTCVHTLFNISETDVSQVLPYRAATKPHYDTTWTNYRTQMYCICRNFRETYCHNEHNSHDNENSHCLGHVREVITGRCEVNKCTYFCHRMAPKTMRTETVAVFTRVHYYPFTIQVFRQSQRK